MAGSLGVVPGGVSGPPAEGFEVAYADQGGSEFRRSLVDAWAVRFEDAAPVRAFKSYKGQRHLPGLWWSSTVGGHIGYESWLERDHVMLLDFDPSVVGISSQPFWLFWRSDAGKSVRMRRTTSPAARTARTRGVHIELRIRAVEHEFNRRA
ncbi:TnsA-like heteromeric transposase endonuclease subunit [Streptomyces sp. NPDC001832]|uniref:TnsA-like heteromeric transposase endonuclease subunit n=1 Tax=Streptomyces sp. NPDC001832 TaxID=3154527 RepID=UPI00331D17E8